MDIDEIPGFFLFIKFDFLFHRVEVNFVMVTNANFSLSVI